jgi:hypothetical protein
LSLVHFAPASAVPTRAAAAKAADRALRTMTAVVFADSMLCKVACSAGCSCHGADVVAVETTVKCTRTSLLQRDTLKRQARSRWECGRCAGASDGGVWAMSWRAGSPGSRRVASVWGCAMR